MLLKGPRGRSAGVRDEDVDPAVSSEGPFGHGLDVAEAREIAREGRRRDRIGPGDRLRGLTQLALPTRTEDQGSPLGGKLLRHGPSETAARGGDEGDPSAQTEVHALRAPEVAVRAVEPILPRRAEDVDVQRVLEGL